MALKRPAGSAEPEAHHCHDSYDRAGGILAQLLPVGPDKVGRPARNNRRFINAVFRVLAAGDPKPRPAPGWSMLWRCAGESSGGEGIWQFGAADGIAIRVYNSLAWPWIGCRLTARSARPGSVGFRRLLRHPARRFRQRGRDDGMRYAGG